MASTTMMTKASCSRPVAGLGRFAGLRKDAGCMRKPEAQFSSVIRSVKPAPGVRRSALQSTSFMEIAQVASEQSEIFGAAGIVFACTLVGLAAGFVLLRVESLVEEGKIEL
ncbi:hypothetical protein BSKO_04712 [Bryopsis sp. KO-2023]|nr:hypothetical protein BSKO_04712 [Bryopsis sp. KO-2023]